VAWQSIAQVTLADGKIVSVGGANLQASSDGMAMVKSVLAAYYENTTLTLTPIHVMRT